MSNAFTMDQYVRMSQREAYTEAREARFARALRAQRRASRAARTARTATERAVSVRSAVAR